MIASKVADLLLAKGLTLAVAESCTGGLISDMITDVPGASQFFLMGIVTYSDGSKVSVLGVRESTLMEHGAVSRQAAEEMAVGVRNLRRADLGLSATGIAGPGGATEEKPVGLVYLSLSHRHGQISEREIFSGDRREVKRAASEHALGMILGLLE